MRTETRDRLVSGVGAVAVTALIGGALVVGLTVSPEAVRETVLALVAVAPPSPPPPPKPPEPVRGTRAAKAAAAPAPKAKAVPVVIPPPIVPVPAPPIVAAPKPALGAAAASGASNLGSGTGAGGEGDGPGGGGDGGDGDDTPPRQIGGRLRFSDLPADRRQSGSRWRVGVRYHVGTDGRVHDCGIARSSGDMAVDRATCAAITNRYRFRPGVDGAGRPFDAVFEENQEWVIDREGGDGDPPPR